MQMIYMTDNEGGPKLLFKIRCFMQSLAIILNTNIHRDYFLLY